MIKTNKLSYSYDGKTTLNFPDIACDAGKLLLLLGKSGVGKSTLLHLLGGLMPPKSGEILVGKMDIASLNNNERDSFRGEKIGIIFQQPHFVQSISVIENLYLAQSLAGKSRDEKSASSLLENLGIAYKANAKPRDLSQGEQQRLSIARALINKPTLILADEPTSALDDDNTNIVIDLLSKQAKEINAALIVVTHDSRLKNVIPNQVTLNA